MATLLCCSRWSVNPGLKLPSLSLSNTGTSSVFLPPPLLIPVGLERRGPNSRLPASTSGIAGTPVHTTWIKHFLGEDSLCGPQLLWGGQARWREKRAEGSELTYKRWRSVHHLYFIRPDSPAEGTVLPIVTIMCLPTPTDAIKSSSEAAHNLDTLSPLSQARPEAPLLGASRGCQTDR